MKGMHELNKLINPFINLNKTHANCKEILKKNLETRQNNVDFLVIKLLKNYVSAKKYLDVHQIMEKLNSKKAPFNIANLHQILYNSSWVHNDIKLYIIRNAKNVISYHVEGICNLPININFTLFNDDDDVSNDVYYILIWLYMIKEYINERCTLPITIYIYKTPYNKKMPVLNEVLGSYHLNSAVTITSSHSINIVLWRDEEWFKVFVHETMHGFKLDFSDNPSLSNIRNVFHIKKELRVFEAYTETWAKIINCLFTSAIANKCDNLNNNVSKFITTFYMCMNIEALFTITQMVKILDNMHLKYQDLHSKNKSDMVKVNTLYKDKTNFFEYFVLTASLMFNYNRFMEWCYKNNKNHFIKFSGNQHNFSDLILKHYKSANFVRLVKCIENLVSKNEYKFLSNTARFTLCGIV